MTSVRRLKINSWTHIAVRMQCMYVCNVCNACISCSGSMQPRMCTSLPAPGADGCFNTPCASGHSASSVEGPLDAARMARWSDGGARSLGAFLLATLSPEHRRGLAAR